MELNPPGSPAPASEPGSAPASERARGEDSPPPRGFAFLVDQFEEIVSGTAVAVIILTTTWGVITRYVLPQPAAWAGEIAMIAFAWAVFFGAAGCIKYHLHPTIDLLVTRLPAPIRRMVVWTNNVLLAAFFAFMVWYGTGFAIDALESPSAVLQIPLTWLYGPVTIAFALMLIRHLQVVAGHRWHIAADRESHAG